uniref:Tetraspanin 4 n=1 Tax=Taeniopygia guttata TaxID=59729 RepID=H0ZHJ2_TAEGU
NPQLPSPVCWLQRGHLVNWDHTKCSEFPFLHQLGGCGILGVGIWLAVTQGNFATLSSSFPSLSAANLLIVTGTFVMIIGFVGCIGAIKENKCLLLSVSIELLQCLLSCDAGAIAMHAAVTCISTEVAHLTQM